MKLYPEFFRRLDERPDELFYLETRRVRHMDEGAAKATAALYRELLPEGGEVLELMAGHRSYLPETLRRVVGLGLDRSARENPRVDEVILHDLNRQASLPFADEAFAGAVCTAGIQYLTRPDELFPEVARCLKPGAPFIVSFSNRMLPTKAILAWRASDDAAHLRLVRSYFGLTDAFGPVQHRCYTPDDGDPLYAVWAKKHHDSGQAGP